MDKTLWKQGIENLQKDDITFQELIQSWCDDIMMEYPGVTVPDDRIIIRHAMNRATVGRKIREEIEYYMENGEFWSE